MNRRQRNQYKRLRSISGRKEKTIDKMPDAFLSDMKKEQKDLVEVIVLAFAQMFDIKDDVIISNQSNISRVAASKALKEIFKRLGQRITNKMINGYLSLMGLNKKYFAVFKTGLLLDAQSKAESRVWASLGYDPETKKLKNGSYLDSITKDKTLERRIKVIATRAAIGGTSWLDFRKNVSDYILKTGKNGALSQVLNRSAVYDSFAEVDRTLTAVYAEELDLKYFIYQGGLMTTTRPFCKERNGKVFSSEEIDAWNDLTWQGKNEGSTVQISQGGYNCRHFYSPISEELAEQIRPDLLNS